MVVSKPRTNRKSKYEIDSGSEGTHDTKYFVENDKKSERKSKAELKPKCSQTRINERSQNDLSSDIDQVNFFKLI